MIRLIKASDESIVNLSRDVGPNVRRRRRFAKRLGYDPYKSKEGTTHPRHSGQSGCA
ncbi:protein of unknown function [Paraburkholderia kururiensis]